MLKNGRIRWIDNLKGFILLTVILYHAQVPWYVVRYVSSWFMPCFFLISGMLFELKENSVKQTCIHRVRTLLLPYFMLSILFVFLNPNNYQGDILHNFRVNAWDILMGNSGFMTVSLWFVYVLFEVCCVTAIGYYITKNLNSVARKLIFVLTLVSCLIADFFLFQTSLPFKLGDFFIAWFMYLLGYMLQSYIKRREEYQTLPDPPLKGGRMTLSNIYLIVSSLFLLSVAIALHVWQSVDGTHKLFIRVPLLICGSFSAMGVTYILSRTIPHNFIGNVLGYLSKNAMCLLAIHLWAICMLRQYAPSNSPLFVAICALGISLLIMPICSRYFPWFVGQKR